MKKTFLPLTAVLALAAVSCESAPWRQDSLTVDDSYLVRVPDDQREEIASLRAERAERADRLAYAERRVEEEIARRKVAEQEVGVAEQEVERAEAQLEAAKARGTADKARRELEAAKAHVAWAEAQVAYHGQLIDAARADRAVAERRVELAEARLEARKAMAVNELEGGGAPEFDVYDYQCAVEEAELEVEMAKIEASALRKKAEARKELVERRREDTPKELRSTWRSPKPIEASQKSKND